MLNLLGVVVAFIFVIFLIRKKFNFGLSLIFGAFVVGIFSLQEIKLSHIPRAFIEATFYHFNGDSLSSIYSNFQLEKVYTDTIELAILMTLIFMLAKLMQETGAIDKLINSLRTIFSKGGSLGLIPAIYGLMPVPGGALFSAPTIDKEGEKYKLDKNQKNFLNVWFRHIWFPIYPISSALLLICSKDFSNIEIHILILANIPAFFASVLIGTFYLRRFIRKIPKPTKKKDKDYGGLIYLLPPILPLIIYGLFLIINFPKYRSFIIGVTLSIILVFYLTKTNKKEYSKLIKKSLTINLALAILGIMIFREMIAVSGADLVIANIIKNSPIPAISMVVIIPLILGVLTGYNLGAVALSYPIVVPFFPEPISFVTLVGLTSLIFISSLVGYLISPIHLCNVLSSDYLKTDTTRMYKNYIPSSFFVLGVQLIVISLLIYLFG